VLVAVLPAHVQTVRVLRGRKLAVAVARIPLQVPMMQTALRVARTG
jgi:hypothetical protein